jgi:hypothetical protein
VQRRVEDLTIKYFFYQNEEKSWMVKLMPTPESILKEIDKILSELIVTAERMQSISHQVVSKEELSTLQEAQSKLVEKLVGLDAAFKQAYKGQPEDKTKELRAKIDAKLAQFEKLNASFIENISGTQSLLKFGKRKK